jgi:hypothetical protein
MNGTYVFAEIKDFYRIIPLKPLRRTPGVLFDNVPMQSLPRIDAIDRVLHEKGAVSPDPSRASSAPGTCTRTRTTT